MTKPKTKHYKPKLTPQEKNRLRVAKLQKRLDERILSGEYKPRKIAGLKNKIFTERVVAVKVDTTKIIRKVRVETTETIRFAKKG